MRGFQSGPRAPRTALAALLGTVLAITVSPAAFGQLITGNIVGTVTDPSGNAIAGATVRVVNSDTQLAREAQTNSNGDYAINLLPIGNYSVTVAITSFKSFQVESVPLSAGQETRVDARLQLGNVSERVEVTGEAPLLQTDNATVGTSVTEQTLMDVPLNGRNFIDLVNLQPGVNPGMANSVTTGARPDDRRQSSSFSANGQKEYINNEMLDGMDNSERYYGLIGIRPSVEGISEVRVDTNSFSADVGRSGGAVVSVLTKSGTNELHGSLYEFLRNDKLDANDFFNNLAGLPVPEYRQNQFGGSVGGPIVKNKTFYFVDVEQLRIVQGLPSGLLTVPTLFEEQHPGNFSDVGGPVISPSAINPVSLKLFALYPAPNVPGAAATSNFASSPNHGETTTTLDARVDHHFSDNDTVFFRYSYNPLTATFPANFPSVNGVNGVGADFIAQGQFPGTNTTLATGAQVNYTHVFTPALLMELRAGFLRTNIQSDPYNYGTNIGNKLGIANSNIDQFSSGMPNIQIGGYQALGDQIALPIINIGNTFQVNGSLTYTKGTHNMRMGAALIRRQVNYFQDFSPEGWFQFNGSPPQTMVAFLEGTPSTILRNNQLSMSYLRSWEPNVYFQDDWHVKSWLTLNLGVRWDVFTPWQEAHNRLANFDIATKQIIEASPSNPTAGIKTDYKDVAPRFGFAAQLGHGMVLRGGYGISFFPGDFGTTVSYNNPPFSPASFVCLPGTPFLPCPPGFGTLSEGSPLPVPSSPSTLSGGLTAKQLDWRSSYLQSYNMVLQKEFGRNVLNVTYAGSVARRLFGSFPADEPLPSTGAPNPYYYAAQLPAVTGISLLENEYNSNYNSLQLVFQHRYSKGLTVGANYTWAHALTDAPSIQASSVSTLLRNNANYDYGNSDLDVRQRFALTAAYELPFGKSLTGFANALFAGWSLNSAAFYETGPVFAVIDGAFATAPINLPGVSSDRPNVISGQPLVNPNWTIYNYINLNAFAVQPKGHAGTESLDPLVGSPFRDWDLSLFKNFNIWERMKLQFRAECFNITNTENFALPNHTFTGVNTNGNPTTAGGFGEITSTRIGANPRLFQFALRLTF